MKTLMLLFSLFIASNAFAGKTLFCHSHFFFKGSEKIAQDGAFIIDQAWLGCKDIKGHDFTVEMGGAGLSFRVDSSLTIISCPFLPKDKIEDLDVTGVRIEASAIIGARAGLYIDPKYGGCVLVGGKLGLGAGTVIDSFRIMPGAMSTNI